MVVELLRCCCCRAVGSEVGGVAGGCHNAMTVSYRRAAGVVWRLAPDRVVLRRVGAGRAGVLDVFGPAAVTWVALDEPATLDELAARIEAAGLASEGVADVVADFLSHGVVVEEAAPVVEEAGAW